MHSNLDFISADSEVSLPGVHFEDCKSYKNKMENFYFNCFVNLVLHILFFKLFNFVSL